MSEDHHKYFFGSIPEMPWKKQKKKRKRSFTHCTLYWIAFAWSSLLRDNEIAVAIIAFIIMLMLINDSR